MGNISSVLKAKRKELGLTLAQIAEKIGVTEATVQRWESGNIKSLRHERIAKLADILGVTPAVLMGWDEPTAPTLPLPHHHRGHSDISGHHQRSDALRRRIHRQRARPARRSKCRAPTSKAGKPRTSVLCACAATVCIRRSRTATSCWYCVSPP